MGRLWNRNGEPGNDGDWAVALAHELAHYFLFLDDTYLGLRDDGLLIAQGDCKSAMGDVYRTDYTEFISDPSEWAEFCSNTLTARTLKRNEWQIITDWFPNLIAPTVRSEGPDTTNFNFTTISVQPPITPTTGLLPVLDQTFLPDDPSDPAYKNSSTSPEAQAFLIRDNSYIIDLGRPGAGQQKRITAPGAKTGDRLCLFDPTQHRFGCQSVQTGQPNLQIHKDDTWRPIIQLTPVTSQTFTLEVKGLPTGRTLKARLYPEYGFAGEVFILTETNGVYQTTIDASSDDSVIYPHLSGHIQLWDDTDDSGSDNNYPNDDDPHTIIRYAIGGKVWANPFSRGSGPFSRGSGPFAYGSGPFSRGSGPFSRGSGPFSRGSGALTSPDGKMIYFNRDLSVYKPGDLYVVHELAAVPTLPDGKSTIGRPYALVSSPGAQTSLPGSITFQYLTPDLGITDENGLTIHFWNGSSWLALDTVVDPYFNLASAKSQGVGTYALLGGTTQPLIVTVSPAKASNDIPLTLTISGQGFLTPTIVTLKDPVTAQEHQLAVQSVATDTVTAHLPANFTPREYQLTVTNLNGNQPVTSPQPGTLALFPPAPSDACFHDPFESGTIQWKETGQWGIVQTEGDTTGSTTFAMTDSPNINYDSAITPNLTFINILTSHPINLTNCPNPTLSFKHKYILAQVGQSKDVAQVQISPNGVDSWQTIAQYPPAPVTSTQLALKIEGDEWVSIPWHTETISMTTSAISTTLRFVVISDQQLAERGWLIEDIVVSGERREIVPTDFIYLPLVIKAP